MRQDKAVQEMAQSFVFLRMTRMNGVNLNLFAFDYDLTWMSFFLDADLRIYCRYGGRDSGPADARLSAAGLLRTMNEVLRIHKGELAKRSAPPKPLEVCKPDDIPTMSKYIPYRGSDCIHCHLVPQAAYDHQIQQGTFSKDALWIYPLPENVGLKLDLVEGNKVREVAAGSPAAKAGLKTGDVLKRGNGTDLLTQADVQFVLNGIGSKGRLSLEAERAGKPVAATLDLDGAWRWQDLSWRKSIRELPPKVGFYGGDLKPEEKAGLKIPEDGLGFKLQFVNPPSPAGKAGLQAGDVIVAVDGKRKVPYRQLRSYFPLEHRAGDRVEVVYLRSGKEQKSTIQIE